MRLWIVIGLTAYLAACEAFITWIEPRHPLGGTPSPPGSPWPYPQSMNTTLQQMTIDPKNFLLTSNAISCDIIDKALKRYKDLILVLKDQGKPEPGKRQLLRLEMRVHRYIEPYCKYPKPEEDESYTLKVQLMEQRAYLEANTVWGALRGLETFSQLVYVKEDTKTYLVNVTSIADKPTFSYRGILLDSARHFQSVKTLKQNLDAMSYNKFNVFHWHLVDDQSWPLVSKVYPNLTQAAYHPKMIYTWDQVTDIIEYARLRGIRVMPEFDTPGHTRALGNVVTDMLTPCYGDGVTPFTPNYTEHSDREILNPMQEKTFAVVKEIVKEFRGLFKDEYIHLGMDEVYYGCWTSSPVIKQFMKTHNLAEIKDLENYYVDKTIKNVHDVGYKYMTWQDPVDNGVEMDKDAVIEVWKDTSLDSALGPWHDYIKEIAKKGYKMVVSACWYLNYISYGPDWKKYYDCDPRGFEGTDQAKQLVIGGEACLWAEYVDGTNLIGRMWPRAAAVGERLWSSSKKNDTDEAQWRLDEQRCRMVRRGLPASPIMNGYCGDYDYEMEANWP